MLYRELGDLHEASAFVPVRGAKYFTAPLRKRIQVGLFSPPSISIAIEINLDSRLCKLQIV